MCLPGVTDQPIARTRSRSSIGLVFRTPRLAVALATVAVVLAGCGGGDDQQRLSKSEYQAAIQEIVQDSAAPTGLYTDLVVGSRPQEECASMMRTFYEEVNDLVERVAALEPPTDVESIQEDFVSAARQSVDQVGEIRDRVEADEVSCGRELNDQLYGMPSSDQAVQAISGLEKQGYVVFGQ
jgi:hypothetical protein